MIGDAFVFDGVAHPYNLTDPNFKSPEGRMLARQLYEFHVTQTPSGRRKLSEKEFFTNWTPEMMANMLFEESVTDMAVAHPLHFTDMFRDGLAAWEKCASMAEKYDKRCIFYGNVNPLEGNKALDLLEIQITKHNARAVKLYGVRYDYGDFFSWRMDDPRIAFPIFERAKELGVNIIAVHKGFPLGPQPTSTLGVSDMDRACSSFPDIDFIVFHPGLLAMDELCLQYARYDNLWVSLAATINYIWRAPKFVAEIIGKLLYWGGPDRIITGSESPMCHPQWALEAFWNFKMPEDLRTGYGYPELSSEIKKKILGENLARLHGINIEQKKKEIANDFFSKQQAEKRFVQ